VVLANNAVDGKATTEAKTTAITHKLVQGSAGLSYATFGYYKRQTDVTVDGKLTDRSVLVDTFAGNGVDDGISKNDVAAMMELQSADTIQFTGRTVASLNVGDGDTFNSTDLTGTATLTFSQAGGTPVGEQLALSFNNWYDVKFADASSVELIHKTGVANDFNLTKAGVFDASNRYTAVGVFDAKYYTGSKGNEAVGTFWVDDMGNLDKWFELDGAFGGRMVD
jgi:hypothetical protein